MSSNENTRVLIVDDEKAIRSILKDSLKDEGFNVQTAEDGLSGLSKIKSFKPDIVLLDIWMPGEMDGIEVLQKAKAQFPAIQYIIMSGHGTIETAVKATKLGAWDFVEKPLSIDKILILLKNIALFNSQKSEKDTLLNRLRDNLYIVGESEKMRALKQMIARVAPTSSWVLVTGEPGVGKELVAKNIHYLSPRAGRALVEVNCVLIPKELMLAEIFGYARGTFAADDGDKKGKLDAAQGGTLLLEEVSELCPEAQLQLLNLIQNKSFKRVNGNESIDADVRVLATTSKDMKAEIKAGRFMEELYYRLNIVPFDLAPLKSRKEDLPMLIQHFGDAFANHGGFLNKSLSEEALDLMFAYNWPGNVLELRNFVERLYILTPGEQIDVQDVRFAGLNYNELDTFDFNVNFREARARFEKDFILKAIEENQGNITKTAETIGLERSYLHRKIKSYGIDV